ncbi:apolipoprotein N-acyltransferase [Labilibaculum filiforme]|uniref:Apolipoprotein N-acyltransferase n=1 Tax=Labilibaculum filiforme TaxID=1940526 RepID=A0A2N3I5S2_9BACT|nr:apolipoprotein N-acyltransferase [Labilibaculum filiforme]PKQ65660.1 apolipoprotein N-acyltransferase [Labilibaculum filiforme]
MNKKIISAIASGLLLGIPFCIPSFFFLLFFAWIPLLWLEEKTINHPNSYVLFNYAFLSFLIWNILAYWWVGKAQITGVILIILINSLLLALIFWMISRTRKSLKIAILFPFLLIWLGFEYFDTWWDLAWPWLNLGNAFASAPKWIQWYEFTGTRGGSLWIILINLGFFALIKNPKKKIVFRAIGMFLLIGIPLLFSIFLYHQKENVRGTKSFALIQPNLDPYTEKFVPENEEKHFADFLKTADSICSIHHPEFLFAPETVILTPIDETKPNQSYNYLRLLELKKKYPKTKILIGTHSKIESESFNSALFLSDTITPEFYHKTKLVPLFERVPFDKYLSFLKDYSIEIGGYQGTYSSNNDIDYFLSDSIALVPVVCFESIFGDYCAQRVPEIPSFICMITNDGWWKTTPGYQHHFNFSRLRAIESRRDYIRVANNGISAHINSKGTIIAKTKWWNKTVLTGELILRKEKTFYSEHGDYIGRVCLFIATLLLIFVKIRVSTQSIVKRNS